MHCRCAATAQPAAAALLSQACHHLKPCRPSLLSFPSSRSSGSSRSSIARRGYGTAGGGLRKLLRVSEEVADAVATNKPVVALESTIYTHGALGNDLDLEGVVRRHGAVPAVCGILHGVPTVGLTPREVELMVSEGAQKASRRDLALLAATGLAGGGQKRHGGTTISGTMVLARLAGIRVFGTGGLGGVHRGGQDSLDVSADLTELGRTRVAVVSSGCKGFLDIPRTLEYLETQGVLVATLSSSSSSVDFPAFWARESGVRSPAVVRDARQAAAIVLAQERLGVESGLLFANPIPEEHAIPRRDMEAVIDAAVREADEKGFTGSNNTPYVLTRIRELTRGRSVSANKHLVRANVAVASQIAVELAKLQEDGDKAAEETMHATPYLPTTTVGPRKVVDVSKTEDSVLEPADVLVAGSVALDLSYNYIKTAASGPASIKPHTSNPASITQSVGGVGHNVALAAHRIGGDLKVKLCSLVGNDVAGTSILSSVRETGLDTTYIQQLGRDLEPLPRTAQYVAVNDADRSLALAMADMAIFTDHPIPPSRRSALVAAARPRWIVVDANWSAADIRAWARAANANASTSAVDDRPRVAFEPVSVAKAARLFAAAPPRRDDDDSIGIFPDHTIDLATPNEHELAALHAAARDAEHLDRPAWFAAVDAMRLGPAGARDRFERLAGRDATDAGLPQRAVQLLPFVPIVATTLGAKGVLLTALLRRGDPLLYERDAEPFLLARGDVASEVGGVYMRWFPPAEEVDPRDVVSVNGVGDTFLGALVAGLAMGGRVERLVHVAQRAAVMTLRSRESVSPLLGSLRGDLVKAVRGE